jgi:beta-glucuronidase
MPVPSFEKQRRATIGLGGPWRKQRFAANDAVTMSRRDSAGMVALLNEAAGRTAVAFDDAAWPVKTIPGVENTLNGLDVRPEAYEDGVWYRRAFVAPDSLGGKFARLVFYAVNYVADVWLNGTYLGYHEGGYTSFAFDATPALRFDTTNVLVVRVDNPAWGTRSDVVPYGTIQHKPDWFNYTGIIHDVYLEFSDPLSIARADVIPQGREGAVQATVTAWNASGSAKSATVTLDVHEAVIDSATLSSERPADLLGPLVASVSAPVLVGADSAAVWRTTIVVPTPRLWSPKAPQLYVLRARLSGSGTGGDEICTQFGIRELKTEGSTLVLNNKPLFLPGVARHEDHVLYGRSVPPAVIVSDLKMVAALNATFLRTAHYPNHPFTYMVADRLGISTLEEIPVWWFDEQDAWLKQDVLRHIHEQMWREMLFRDRNRPSIFFWSTCNECKDVSNRQNFIQRLNAELDTQYPDGRFVTQSAAADRPGPDDPSQAKTDVAGWTMYFGIFHGGTYADGTRQFLQQARVAYPHTPFLDTEFGYWSTEDLGAAALQVTVFDSTFRVFNEFVAVDSTGTYRPANPLAATTWWCMFDWYTVQTGNQTMGLYKMDHSTIKPVAERLRNVYRPFRLHSETAGLTAVAAGPVLPAAVRLEANFPNPFNPATTLTYALPQPGPVRLVICDVLGREVAVLTEGVESAGVHEVRWNAAGHASGVYYARVEAAGLRLSRPMLLVK